jgi:hypothetical protein
MPKEYEDIRIDQNIRTIREFKIHGMDDYYLEVSFRYAGRSVWNGCIPLQSKYNGVKIFRNKQDVSEWAKKCYGLLNPSNNTVWQNRQSDFWADIDAHDTHAVFEALNNGDVITSWLCRKCGPVPKVNPQPAARIKNLKERGFFIATKRRECANCGSTQFFDILIRLPIQAANNVRRENISARLRHRIKTLLQSVDACFDEKHKPSELIIDHKFPSARWIRGEAINNDDMTDDEIRKKFQLLTNQANLQKERYCNRCVQNGVRGDFFGIKWYSSGTSRWSGTSPSDERGCEGCCWYDLASWKNLFNDMFARLGRRL